MSWNSGEAPARKEFEVFLSGLISPDVFPARAGESCPGMWTNNLRDNLAFFFFKQFFSKRLGINETKSYLSLEMKTHP